MFGIEHLANCHGEIAYLVTALALIPFIGPWIKAKMKQPPGEDE